MPPDHSSSDGRFYRTSQPLDIDSLCQVPFPQFNPPPPNMLSRTISALGQKLTERAVLRTIRKRPGLRLYEINDLTLQSHHSWGTKSVVQNLERQGKITVVRNRLTWNKKSGMMEPKPIKPLYFAC